MEASSSSFSLAIWLLGDFRVRVGSREVSQPSWRLRKASSLIKILALAPGHRLHREHLVEALWPGGPPGSGVKSLHQALHFARSVVEPDLPPRASSTYLKFEQDSVVLTSPTGMWIDVEAFESAAASARQVQTVEAYRRALDMYTADLLQEDPYEDWAVQRREELSRLQTSLLFELERLQERDGDLEAAIETFNVVVKKDPGNEDAHAALMRLYALSGRRQEAVRQYQILQKALEQHVETVPSSETQALYKQILEGSIQVPRASTDGSLVPRKTPTRVATNLPASLTDFVGRDRDIAEVRQLLLINRLVTLTGSGGVGKTRLALKMAEENLDRFPHGVWMVELGPLRDPLLVPQTVAFTLGLREEPGRSLLATLMEHLRDDEVLLVLDGCEHLVDACASLVDELVRACPRLHVLTTSRERLAVPGEVAWRVPSLSTPHEGDVPELERLADYEAARLFVIRATAARSDFILTHSNVPAVAQLCRRLDGIPLAIELAAARVQILPVEQVAARLDDRFRLLTLGSRAVVPRHRTLRATMDWSYELLGEPERVLLRRLSVFGGGFTLEAVEAVCAGEGVDQSDVLDLLTRLVDKSLVLAMVKEGPLSEARYWMLDTLRTYAAEKLSEAEEEPSVSRRHRDYFLGWVELVEPKLQGETQGLWLTRVELEHDNLRAAFRFSQKDGEQEAGLRMAGALWWFWYVRGYMREGREWLGGFLSTEGASASARAKAFHAAGSLAWRQGDYVEAGRSFEESLKLNQALGDMQGLALAKHGLGLVAHRQGDYRRANSLCDESLTLCRQFGETRGMLVSLIILGLTAGVQGEYERAEAFLKESLELSQMYSDAWALCVAKTTLGIIAYYQGSYSRAKALLEESLTASRDLEDKRYVALATVYLGLIALHEGDDALARQLCETGVTQFRKLGDKWGVALSLFALGNVEIGQGNHDGARWLLKESLLIRHEIGDQLGTAESLSSLAEVAPAMGRNEQAVLLLAASDEIRSRIGAPLPVAERGDYARRLDTLRAELGEEEFSAAWRAGGDLSFEEILSKGIDPAT